MEKDNIVIPKKGDELYDGLLEILKGKNGLWPWRFTPDWADESEKDEYCLNNGISEAERCLLDYHQYGELGLENNKGIPQISPGVYIMIWVLLKTQPDIGAVEDELAQRIFDKFNGRIFKYGEEHCRLFNMCVELVTRVNSPETAFGKVEESLQFAMNSVNNAQKKVRDLKGAVKHGQVRIESHKKQIKTLTVQIGNLENKCEQLQKEKEALQKEMISEGHQQQVGERYLRKVFEEYLRDADEMDQSIRKDWFNVLQGFCSIEGVPKEVKKMIQSLKKMPKKANDGSTTVNIGEVYGTALGDAKLDIGRDNKMLSNE